MDPSVLACGITSPLSDSKTTYTVNWEFQLLLPHGNAGGFEAADEG